MTNPDSIEKKSIESEEALKSMVKKFTGRDFETRTLREELEKIFGATIAEHNSHFAKKEVIVVENSTGGSLDWPFIVKTNVKTDGLDSILGLKKKPSTGEIAWFFRMGTLAEDDAS